MAANTTIADLKNRIQQKIHGQSLSKLQDVYGLIREGAANILSRMDPLETQRVTSLENGLYDQVYHYAAPADLKKDRIIAIRPQGMTTCADAFTLVTQDEFYRRRGNGCFVVETRNGVKVLKIAKPLVAGATINTAESLSLNGAWAATAAAQNLAVDSTNYLTGSSSLAFDLAAAGSSGYIENSTMQPVDLSSGLYSTTYSVFVPVYLPSGSAITSATLRWGSSSGSYYSATVAATNDATAFSSGWNILRFDRASATETGSVDDAAVDYLRFSVAYGGTAVSGIRVDSFVARVPTAYEISYYSGYAFRSSSGTVLEQPTSDSDLVNLDPDGVALLVYEIAILASQELQGEDSQVDIEQLTKLRDEAETYYKSGTKTEAKKRSEPYYRPRRPRR